MSYNWGPYLIIPSEALKNYSGIVKLQAELDESLPPRQLEDLGTYRWATPGNIVAITHTWYYRKKKTKTWIKIGDPNNKLENFNVIWDSTGLKNAPYEVLGRLRVFVKKDDVEDDIAGDSAAKVTATDYYMIMA